MVQQQAEQTKIPVLPYSLIVGQASLKLALELAYIMPRLGGVLLSGHRGTGKSTAVRAFAQMVYEGEMPVTLPKNATEDREVGGRAVRDMLQKKPKWQKGLLLEAKKKLLYVDEINLLDDHIVNIILDVTATGKLVVARDGNSESYDVPFTLVGTMNPEEGGLRPQLLDRFGLMVNVTTERDALATEFKVEGNRGERVLAMAARAYAARENQLEVTAEHVAKVAPLALQHRRPAMAQNNEAVWSPEDDAQVQQVIEKGG